VTAVRCEGLVHIYRREGEDVVAVRGVDLDVESGEQVALLGPSGSGKSTLLSMLGGLLRPSAGRLRVGDLDLARATERELRRLRGSTVGLVLQGAARNVLPYGSVADNVRFAQRGVRRRDALDPRELLAALGCEDLRDAPVARLSAGELQRVALAVAQSTRPGLLLADEPTSQLDTEARDQVLAVLDRVGQEYGTTVVVVTHDAEVGLALGRTVTMRDGRVGAEGRRGEDYAVVGRDGSVHLPEELADEWPPGTLVRVAREGDGVLRLTREEEQP
jgi:putative ABC transport system ATP-binding protein